MKRNILSVLVSAAIVVLGVSCGNGDAGGVADDGLFGQLPAITADHGEKAISLMEELGGVTSKEEAEAVSAKVKTTEEELNAAIEAERQNLKDKEFPTVVSDSVPFKLTAAFKLDMEESEDDELVLVAYVENIADTYRGFHDGKMDDKSKYDVRKTGVVLVDGDDNPLCTPHRARYVADVADGEDAHAVGAKGKITVKIKMAPWNAEWLGKTAKLMIVNEGSSLYKTTRKATDDADVAYFHKIHDLQKTVMEKIKANVK